MFSFEPFWCLPIEEENIFLIGVAFYPSLFTDIWRDFSPDKGDGHKCHLETFSVGGLTLTPSNVRICERTFPRQNLIPKLPLSWWPKASPKVVSEVFSETGFTKRGLKVGISEGTFKKVSEPGLTLPPPHFRISERIFQKPLTDALTFGVVNVRIYESFFRLHLDNWITCPPTDCAKTA